MGGGYTFPKGICLKVNIIEWQEFEPAYLEATVQRISYYATSNLRLIFPSNIKYNSQQIS